MKISFSSWFNLLKFKQDNFNGLIKELWRDTKLRWFFLSSIFLNIIIWITAVLINLKGQENVITLHHNIYFGITLIGDPRKVYFIPFLGLIIITVNLIFAQIIKKQERFFIYIFAVSSLLINIFLLLGMASIVLINFR